MKRDSTMEALLDNYAVLRGYVEEHCRDVSPSFEEYRAGHGWLMRDLQALYEQASEIKDVDHIRCSAKDYDRYYSILTPFQRFVSPEWAKRGEASLLLNGIALVKTSSIGDGIVRFFGKDGEAFYEGHLEGAA